jgi:hypothetical protein
VNIISLNKSALVLHPSKCDENWRAFIFDIGIVPEKPTPKKLIIQKKAGRNTITWSMSWSKFLKQTCIDTVAIIDKSAFKRDSRSTKHTPDQKQARRKSKRLSTPAVSGG